MRAGVLLSAGRHPVSGRPAPVPVEAQAVRLALALGADVTGLHAGAEEAPIREHLGRGLQEAVLVPLPADGDPLPALVEAEFPVRPDRRGVFGHSMGGHGALVTALREPERWHSVSAFAPIANPVAVPWGEKAFTHYLGPDRAAWAAWDASLLMRARPYPGPILVDQGKDDQFLASQLHPEALEAAAQASGQELTLRRQPGDHSYWFIQSFMGDHIAHHARRLG